MVFHIIKSRSDIQQNSGGGGGGGGGGLTAGTYPLLLNPPAAKFALQKKLT